MRSAAALALGLGFALSAPAACFFPSYTYDLPNGAGGGSSSGDGASCTSADCSDPSCAAVYSCVSSPPDGWMGYFSLYDGAPEGDPGCPAEFPSMAFVGNADLVAPQAQCSTCSCGDPQGQSCLPGGTADDDDMGFVDEILVNDEPCGTVPNCILALDVSSTWDGTCFGMTEAPPNSKTCGAGNCSNGTEACNKSVQVTPLKVGGGSCTPSAQSPALPAISWSAAGAACGGVVAGTGCNAGKACLPKPKAPFEAGVCILQAGDVACPPGQFTQKHTFYTNSDDTRDCSSCACGDPAGSRCSATLTLYSDGSINTCNMLLVTLHPTTESGDCVDLPSNAVTVASRKATFTSPSGGSCQPSGGAPTGSVTPTDPTTFCCVP